MTINHHGSVGGASLSKNAKWYLLGIAIIGALIRIALCYDKPFLGDEVGTLIYIKKDIPFLLSHFATWLTMNYFLVAEKLVSGLLGENALGLELIPLSAGIMTIPLYLPAHSTDVGPGRIILPMAICPLSHLYRAHHRHLHCGRSRICRDSVLCGPFFSHDSCDIAHSCPYLAASCICCCRRKDKLPLA